MTDRQECIETGEISRVLALAVDHPRRRHLEACPRCASRLLLYRRFEDSREMRGADPEAADEYLAAVMSEAIHGETDLPLRRNFFSAFFGAPGVRPMLVAAAVVLVAAVVWWQPWDTPSSVLRVLRGDGEVADVPAVSIEAAMPLEDGGMRLAWHPVPGADDYVVSVRTPDLREIARFGPAPDTTRVILRSMLAEEMPPVVLWRVVAFRNGDEIARSQPATLEFP